MSKNEHEKDDDLGVRCARSGLSDPDSCNNKEEGGKYLLASLLEIRLSFRHYRCETLANYLDGALNRPSTSTTHYNLGSLCPSQPRQDQHHSPRLIRSLPSSPPSEHISLQCHSDTSQLLPDSKSTCKPASARFHASDFHVLLSKIARFKRHLHLHSSDRTSFSRPKRSLLHSNWRQGVGQPSEPTLRSPGASGNCGSDGGGSISAGRELESTRFATKHVHSQRCGQLGDVAAGCSTSAEQSTRAGPRSSPGLEISSGPSTHSTNPVNSSSDHSSSSRTASHLVEPPRFEHIPNTQQHSSSQSFSNISSSTYSSLAKDATHPTVRVSPVKHSQLDFRSISEYSFTPNSLSHYIKADVCSLPIRMDDDNMSSKMLENKAPFGESQRRMPSYVSISRAISGYANYNRYSSDLRRDSSFLDSLLPSRASTRANGDHHHSAQGRPLVDDQVDNFCSLPYEPTQEKVCPADLSKSFLQKKIESLYGQTFAEDWRKSRQLRSSSPKPNTQSDKTRSPSCPPSRIAGDAASSLLGTLHQKNNCSLDNSRENINLSQLSNAESNVREQEQQSQPILGGDCLAEGSAEHEDGHWFLKLLKQSQVEIQVHIERYEAILAAPDVIPEEAVGKIRATIGKANLLMNKKLTQFDQLCRDSIVQREDQEFKINPDDLRGFWDMVTIQVEEVKGAFEELDQLRQNNWTAVDDPSAADQKSAPRKPSNAKHNTSNSPRALSKLVSPSNSPKSSSQTASPNGLDRESERKSRLMEIKRRGKLKAREKAAEEEITIFVPAADNDLDK